MNTLILVPHLNGIEYECEQGLRYLEYHGIKIWRRRGSSAVDVARNAMASQALYDNFDSIFFIDSDISFDPKDVIKLIERPEPVIAGIYAKKGVKGSTSIFLNKDTLRFAATGFLRIHTSVLREMIEKLKLPLCNTQWGKGVWPFFQPTIIPHGNGYHYLAEDWAFSYRLHLIGVTPIADTSVKLVHWGRFGYTVGDQNE